MNEDIDWNTTMGDDFRAAVNRARDLSECRKLAEGALKAASDSRDYAGVTMDAANDAAQSVRAAHDFLEAQMDSAQEAEHAAKVTKACSIVVAVCAAGMLTFELFRLMGW